MFSGRLKLPRGLLWALGASLLLHAVALWAAAHRPGWLDALVDSEPAAVLDARLLAPPAAPRKAARRRSVSPRGADDFAWAATGEDSLPAPQAIPDTPTLPEPPEALQALDQIAAALPDAPLLLPVRGRIRFSVRQGPDGMEIGKAVHEWRHDDQHYTLTGTTQATGLFALLAQGRVVQTSEGGFAKGELRPREFKADKGDGDVQTASFNWIRRVVTFNGGQEVPFGDDAQDLLSMFYQLTQAAQRGEGFIMAVANGRKLERYAFEWLDEEQVTVKAGRFHAWHVRVRAASGGADTTEVWLGQEVAGLPVKIRHTDRKGGVFDQLAEEIDFEGKEAWQTALSRR